MGVAILIAIPLIVLAFALGISLYGGYLRAKAVYEPQIQLEPGLPPHSHWDCTIHEDGCQSATVIRI